VVVGQREVEDLGQQGLDIASRVVGEPCAHDLLAVPVAVIGALGQSASSRVGGGRVMIIAMSTAPSDSRPKNGQT
jgi:hypothetical protein